MGGKNSNTAVGEKSENKTAELGFFEIVALFIVSIIVIVFIVWFSIITTAIAIYIAAIMFFAFIVRLIVAPFHIPVELKNLLAFLALVFAVWYLFIR